MDGLDKQAVMDGILKVADAIPGSVRGSFVLASKKKLVEICEEVERLSGVPANNAIRCNILAMILGWGEDGGSDRGPLEPEPPGSPDQLVLS